MSRTISTVVMGALALLVAGGTTSAATTVDYGRITAVNVVSAHSKKAQTSGAILGGVIGAGSSSNRPVGTVGGAIAGRQLGRMMSRRQTFEYTILLGSSSIKMVTDEAGMRVGDCVAVERGSFNNLRLVDDNRCAPNVTPAPAALNEANSCIKAKEQLLAADTDEAFERAERRMRLLCDD
jgi:outer membrane lipoprotein SlyB